MQYSKMNFKKNLTPRSYIIQLIVNVNECINIITSNDYSKSYVSQKRNIALNYVLELKNRVNSIKLTELNELTILCTTAMNTYQMATGKWMAWSNCRNVFSKAHRIRYIRSTIGTPHAVGFGKIKRIPSSYKYKNSEQYFEHSVKGCKSIW